MRNRRWLASILLAVALTACGGGNDPTTPADGGGAAPPTGEVSDPFAELEPFLSLIELDPWIVPLDGDDADFPDPLESP